MDTNLALTIIGSVLTVIGVVFIALPKVVNEKTIDGLPTEAVNIAAAFRSANGGLGLALGMASFTAPVYLSEIAPILRYKD